MLSSFLPLNSETDALRIFPRSMYSPLPLAPVLGVCLEGVSPLLASAYKAFSEPRLKGADTKVCNAIYFESQLVSKASFEPLGEKHSCDLSIRAMAKDPRLAVLAYE